jgi:hypothetical protein
MKRFKLFRPPEKLSSQKLEIWGEAIQKLNEAESEEEVDLILLNARKAQNQLTPLYGLRYIAKGNKLPIICLIVSFGFFISVFAPMVRDAGQLLVKKIQIEKSATENARNEELKRLDRVLENNTRTNFGGHSIYHDFVQGSTSTTTHTNNVNGASIGDNSNNHSDEISVNGDSINTNSGNAISENHN